MRNIYRFIVERQVLLVLVLICLGWLIYELRYVLLVFFLSYILMAGIVPVVDFLVKKNVPRALAIAVPYAAIAVLILAFITIYIPSLIVYGGTFLTELPKVVTKLGEFFHFHIEVSTSQLLRFFTSFLDISQSGGVLSLAGTAGYGLIGLAAVIATSVYMFLERERVYRRFPSGRERFLDAERNLGKWIRAQLLLSAAVGVLVWILLLAVGVPSSGPLAVLSGVLELIPYAGPVLSAVPAIVYASDISVTRGIIVLLGFIVIHQIENHVLVPNIMKGSVGLSALAVIFIVLAGAELGGIFGAIVAVPLCALAGGILRAPPGRVSDRS